MFELSLQIYIHFFLRFSEKSVLKNRCSRRSKGLIPSLMVPNAIIYGLRGGQRYGMRVRNNINERVK